MCKCPYWLWWWWRSKRWPASAGKNPRVLIFLGSSFSRHVPKTVLILLTGRSIIIHNWETIVVDCSIDGMGNADIEDLFLEDIFWYIFFYFQFEAIPVAILLKRYPDGGLEEVNRKHQQFPSQTNNIISKTYPKVLKQTSQPILLRLKIYTEENTIYLQGHTHHHKGNFFTI